MQKKKLLQVENRLVSVCTIHNQDYICLTDMVRHLPNNHVIISNWLRKKDTLEYLGIWEGLYNPVFKLIEFDEFKSEAGTNRFTLSPQQWIHKTGAIGLYAKSGKYGGTYAHKDIAFEFAAWISPQFKLYLIKEFQRLKEEQDKNNTEWDVRRILAATNYRIHTDAIKEGLIPWAYMSNKPDHLVYADEAELLNLALFGITSNQWKKQYPEDAAACKNLRDHADTTQLIVLSNLESMNAMLIRNGIKDAGKRFEILRSEALKQLESLNKVTKSRSITGGRFSKKG